MIASSKKGCYAGRSIERIAVPDGCISRRKGLICYKRLVRRCIAFKMKCCRAFLPTNDNHSWVF